MKHTNELKKFLAEYERYQRTVLNPAHDELKMILKNWENPDYWEKHAPDKDMATPYPIRTTTSRIKRPEKVVDKILRRKDDFPEGLSIASLRRMHDTIGVRIIVYFPSQLPLIDREFRNSDIMEISEEHPPEAYCDAEFLTRLGLNHIENKHKESGYSSIHYTVRLASASAPTCERPYFEIQVRTLAQELWSELEHVLSYKPENRPHFSAKRRFQILSREVAVIDEHFNLLYEELIHNQETVAYKESDLLTFENLPKVLGEVGIRCALTELNPILKVLFSRGVNTIGDILKVATPRRLATIRNTYVSATGHVPDHLELISALATLKGELTNEIEIERIKSQIEYYQSEIHLKK